MNGLKDIQIFGNVKLFKLEPEKEKIIEAENQLKLSQLKDECI